MGVIMHKRESYPKNGGGTSEMSDIFNAVYPVGSIYMSVNNVNPGLLFGGTWVEWGPGRVPVGVDVNDEDFDTVEQTGGEKTHMLTEAEMPEHTHAFTGTPVTSGSQNANHTHTTTTGNPSANHTHPVNINSGTVSAWHTHTTTTGGESVDHSHNAGLNRGTGGNGYGLVDSLTATSTGGWNTNGRSAAHSHTGTSGNPSANHYHNVNGNTSTVSAWHTHSGTSGTESANHQHSVTAAGTNSNTGSGVAHNVMGPYITCYMWKRTA